MPFADLKIRAKYHLSYMRLYREKIGGSRRPLDKVTRRRTEQELRLKILAHYSNNSMACAHCGFKDIRALSIDHINGGGNQHRKTTPGCKGTGFYYWLRRNNYPEGYQVLCMNCQFIKRAENKEYN